MLTRKLIIRRVWIERTECLATTSCGEVAPNLIEVDEPAGVSRIKEERLVRTDEELRRLLEASQVCPVSAFYVETDSGDIFNIDETDWVHSAVESGNYGWAVK